VTPQVSACTAESCPSGSKCSQDGVCRTDCTLVSGLACVSGQVCQYDFCIGTDPTHDTEATGVGAGGAGGAGAGGSTTNGGSGGAGGQGGGGGGTMTALAECVAIGATPSNTCLDCFNTQCGGMAYGQACETDIAVNCYAAAGCASTDYACECGCELSKLSPACSNQAATVYECAAAMCECP
jgi:hypothetical protein